MSTRVLTAVAWPYANGPRHIGHVSGFGVPSDVFSRYRRMAGDQVLMVSGTDEHGTPIQVQADAEGLTPRQLADKYNGVITKDLQGLGLGLRPLHPHHHDEPLRGRAEPLPRAAPQRLRRRQVGDGRDQPVDRAHAARPLRRGHLPHLRLRRPRAATSATTAATSSTPPTSSTPGRGSTGRRRSSSRPSTSSSTCPRSPSRSGSGCPPAPTGAPTCSSSRPTSSRTSSPARSPVTSTGACPSRSTAGATSR